MELRAAARALARRRRRARRRARRSISTHCRPDSAARQGAMPLLDALQSAAVPRVASATGGGDARRRTRGGRCRAYPIDWAALDRRRAASSSKLDAMQQYAYATGCRRGFVLRYFGDPAAGKPTAAAATTASARTHERVGAGRGARRAPASRRRARRARRAHRTAVAASRRAGASSSSSAGGRAAARARCAHCAASIAREEKVPAYVVFADRTLAEIAVRRPQSRVRAGRDSRRRPVKIEKYGERFLDAHPRRPSDEHRKPCLRRTTDAAPFTMDDSLYFTEQHLAVREMVREFARDEVAPVAAQLRRRRDVPVGEHARRWASSACSACRGPRSSAARGSTSSAT